MSLEPLGPATLPAPLPPAAPGVGTRPLTGTQKAAVLLLRLGAERAAPLLRTLHRSEVSAIMAELAQLGAIDGDLADTVVDEFVGLAAGAGDRPLPIGNVRTARQLLSQSLGDRAAFEVLREVDRSSSSEIPFQFLQGLEPSTIADGLAGEHPQTIALVLTHLTMDVAAEVLGCLPAQLLSEVGVRIGTLDRVTAPTLAAVERALRVRMAPVLQTTYAPGAGGIETLVELLTKVDGEAEEAIHAALEAHDPALADRVRAKMFTFGDLALLDDRQMQLLLRHVEASKLPLALKGVRDDVRSRVFDNLSSRARDNLVDEMDILGQVRLSDVTAAQEEILEVVRTLEASGELVVNRGGGDYVV
jgi:flagellar motor switch protein FliG